MTTIDVVGWKADQIGWTGWDGNARSELSKRLRRAVDGSPSQIKKIERAARSKSAIVIKNVRPEHVESLRQILETMGADAEVHL